jgi:hypothetical protein
LQYDLAVFLSTRDWSAQSRVVNQDLYLGNNFSGDDRGKRRILPVEKFNEAIEGRREPRPTIRASFIAPIPERRSAAGLKPPHDFIIGRGRILRFERLPASVQFSNIIAVGFGGAGFERDQLPRPIRVRLRRALRRAV